MKKIFLLTILLFQLHSVSGQCNITTGTETVQNPNVTYSPKITYLKCSDGFSSPHGYEWMKPTKIYVPFQHSIFSKDYNKLQYTSNVNYQNIGKVIWGNDLNDACNNFFLAYSNPNNEYHRKEGPGYTILESDGSFAFNDEEFIGNKKEFLCFDCGLGYFGVVVLQDNFDKEKEFYSNSSVGFTCGKATMEEAFLEAYKSSYAKLGKDAVVINYLIGVNTSRPFGRNEGSASDIEITSFINRGNSINNEYSVSNLLLNPVYKFSKDANEALKYIKSNIPLEYPMKNGGKINRHQPGGGCSCYFNFNKEYDYKQQFIPNIKYPIFTDKIGSSSKQSGNVQKNQENVKIVNNEEVNSYLTLGDVAYSEGRIEDAKKHYLDVIRSNPNISNAQYNLGVIAYNENKIEEAKKYYLKTIELSPDFKDAYLNLSVLKLDKDVLLTNEMNKLGTTQTENIKYDNLSKKRVQLFRSVAPLLEKYIELDRENLDVKKTLLGIYEFLGDQPKIKVLKQKMQDNSAQNNVSEKIKPVATNSNNNSEFFTSGTVGEIIYYLGKIENMQKHTHVFHLSKKIKSAIASCGCVTVDTNNQDSKSVIATFHGIANHKGPFIKNITITYEDGTTETLSLKGNLL